MLAKVLSCAVVGLDGSMVEVEVDISPGLPAFNIVGLPDTAVQEAKERVRSAIRNSGCIFPMRRITVNLAPADMRKAGPAYDLPIAVGILVSSGQVPAEVTSSLFLGELSLDGTLRLTHGILSMVALAREKGIQTVVVPSVNAQEASLIEGIEIISAASLTELVAHLSGQDPILSYQSRGPNASLFAQMATGLADMAHIKGQEHVKRALEVAAAGSHNVVSFWTQPHAS